jgi:BirA family biotin operon repressor/biotin-[acetyl-CoA-carboxylase] ligase
MSGKPPRLAPPFRLAAYETIGSTNDEAKHLARAGEPEGLVVWAREQHSARGRRGRSWASPPGNLYMSLVLRPRCAPASAAQLGFVTALALGEALATLAPGIDFRLKWPNDVLANGKKLAGILLETEMASSDTVDFVVIGVGVNLISAPTDTPYPATSLAMEGAAGIAPETALAAFIARFATWWTVWRTDGFLPIREAWLAQAIGLGGPVQVRLERDTLDGKFVDLAEDGALLLGMPGGDRRIAAGEIFPVAA